ncbi:ricin B-like lectin R40G2 [Canna indica]|uniref:Ricin B-like lectin R40G2 n=1 Tax=Canna indica TaxID=4628 RepID=A0AAQ3KWH3_9LILI|nr:ricin B-like lectin R40G2 [Canna indica]
MEFPFGHHRPHRRDDDDEQQSYPPPGQHHPNYEPPPPPSSYYGSGAADEWGRPAYPPVQHISHESGPGYGDHRPRPPASGYGGDGIGQEYGEHHHRPPASGYYGGGVGDDYGGRPAYPPVQHVSHEVGSGYGEPRPYSHAPGQYGDVGSELNHHRPPSYSDAHQGGGYEGRVEDPVLASRPTVRVFTRAEENYSLSVRNGKHWIKDLRYSTKVKDQEGFPSFALVNKATGEAVKHSIGATHPVRLVPYKPEYLDESVLWTESRDTGNGFRCIRMVNNIGLNFDAFHGDKEHGGVRDGTSVVLWEWLKGDNQQWKIVPRCKSLDMQGSDAGGRPAYRTVRIYSKADPNYSLSVRDGHVILAPNNPNDPYQHWYKDLRYSTKVKDEEGFPSFALVNHVTGEAIKHSIGASHPVRLVPYNPDYLDESVLWAESNDTGKGYRCIRMVNNIRLNFDALHGDKDHGGVRDGTTVVLWEWLKGDNQRWKIEPQSTDPPTNFACGSAPRQTVRILTKAGPEYSLSVRDGRVILAPYDPNDDYQRWYKEMRLSNSVKDEEGFPSFALVNKATGEAIKHSLGAQNPVRLVPYNPNYLDESILWSESNDTGEGYRCIRMVNNIRLNFDALHGDKDHGGVRDGTMVVLWEWLKGDNQRWKIVPCCKLYYAPLEIIVQISSHPKAVQIKNF